MTVKIRVIRTNYPHWGQFSGINQFLKYIDTNKYHIEPYLVSDNDDDFPVKNTVVRTLLKRYVQNQGMKYYKLSDLTAELNIFLKNLDHSIDIIHYLDGEHTAQYLPLFYKKFHCRTRIIAMYHQPPDLLNILTRKDVIRKLDAAIVVSPEQIPYFKAIMEPEKIFLILHGIDTNYFKPGAQLKADGKFRCITVGHYLRDFKVLRSVAEKLSVYHDIEFTVVDSGKTGPQELGIEDLANVLVYRNSITDDELLKLYQQSQVLFLPLQQTTANNALLEGLSCGIPIVSTLLPSITAYVSEEQAFLIENNEVDQLADALLYLYKNPSERKKMGNASRKRAEELDWQRIAPLYEEVYSQMSHQ